MFQPLVLALLATSALAVPTPRQQQHQHEHHQHNATLASFKVASRPRPDILENVDTAHEMKLLLAKYAVSDVAARGILNSINTPSVDLSALSHPKVDMPSLGDIVSEVVGDIKSVVSKLEPTKKNKHTSAAATAVSVAFTTSKAQPSMPLMPTSVAVPATYSSSITEMSSSSSVEVSSSPASTAETTPVTTVESSSAPATTVESSSWVASTTAPATSAAESSTVETSTPAPSTTAAPTTESSTVAETSAAPSTESSTSAAPTTTTTIESSTTPATTATPTTFSSSYTPAFSFDPTTSETPTSTSATPVSSNAKQAATVAATPEQNDKEYLSPVTIGGQPLNLDFDTGSADLWVFSTSQPSSQTAGHEVFDPSKSSTWSVLSGATWKILYGDGSSASGTVGLDSVSIGGATVPQQAVEIASNAAPSFINDTNNDGLVGLGFSVKNTVSPQKQKTFFENIMDDLQQPLFTVDLRPAAASTYEFGVIDSSKYTGDIHYTGIDGSNGYWQFTSSSYSIAGTQYANANALPAIADTGTSIILMNGAVVGAYYNQVSGAVNDVSNAGGWTYPCSTQLPDFGVGIGDSGFTATVPGASMSFATLTDGVTCFGALQSNSGIGYQIFGDTLLKQYFAVFNGGAKTFGLAAKA